MFKTRWLLTSPMDIWYCTVQYGSLVITVLWSSDRSSETFFRGGLHLPPVRLGNTPFLPSLEKEELRRFFPPPGNLGKVRVRVRARVRPTRVASPKSKNGTFESCPLLSRTLCHQSNKHGVAPYGSHLGAGIVITGRRRRRRRRSPNSRTTSLSSGVCCG